MTKKKEQLTTFLIAHTNKAGTGVGQSIITALNEREARKTFEHVYPEREILRVGIEGAEG